MAEQRCYGCMNIMTGPVCQHCGYDGRAKNAPHQLPAGTVLRDQYLVGRVLGQGGFGITYLGWDLYLDTPIAIKEYFPNGFVSRDNSQTVNITRFANQVSDQFEKNKDRFLKEAKTLARFSDIPEIVHVRNFFQDNGTAYIVMEYVHGITLRQYVYNRGGRLSAGETLSILQPIMEALSKVHSAGLIHRDISPDNIMMLPRGGAKLLDFGSVRDMGDDAVMKDMPRSTEPVVKPSFAPLEQYQRRGNLGPWTDIYALCATIYFCVTGTVPPEAPERMMQDDTLDWSMAGDLTAQQIAALNSGIALLPKNRPSTIEELYQQLFSQSVAQVQEPVFTPPAYQAFQTSEPQDGMRTAPVSVAGPAPNCTLPLDVDYIPPVTGPDPNCTVPVSAPGPAFGPTIPVSVAGPSPDCTMPVSNPGPAFGPTVPVSVAGPFPDCTMPVSNPGPAFGPTIPVSVAGPAPDCTVPVSNPGPVPEYTVPVSNPGPQSTGPASTGEKRKPAPKILIGAVAAVALLIIGFFTIHFWTEPTCTTSEKCSLCGKRGDEPALGHDWRSATCTDPKTCKRCGETTGAALGHVWLDATCGNPKSCARCLTREGEALGHEWLDATYDRPKTCTRCSHTTGYPRGYIGDVDGYWTDETYYYDGASTPVYGLYEPIENCFRLNFDIEVEVEYGNPYGSWALFGRKPDGTWIRLGNYELTEDYMSIPFEFSDPITIEAVASVCLENRYGSFSVWHGVSEVQVRE